MEASMACPLSPATPMESRTDLTVVKNTSTDSVHDSVDRASIKRTYSNSCPSTDVADTSLSKSTHTERCRKVRVIDPLPLKKRKRCRPKAVRSTAEVQRATVPYTSTATALPVVQQRTAKAKISYGKSRLPDGLGGGPPAKVAKKMNGIRPKPTIADFLAPMRDFSLSVYDLEYAAYLNACIRLNLDWQKKVLFVPSQSATPPFGRSNSWAPGPSQENGAGIVGDVVAPVAVPEFAVSLDSTPPPEDLAEGGEEQEEQEQDDDGEQLDWHNNQMDDVRLESPRRVFSGVGTPSIQTSARVSTPSSSLLGVGQSAQSPLPFVNEYALKRIKQEQCSARFSPVSLEAPSTPGRNTPCSPSIESVFETPPADTEEQTGTYNDCEMEVAMALTQMSAGGVNTQQFTAAPVVTQPMVQGASGANTQTQRDDYPIGWDWRRKGSSLGQRSESGPRYSPY